jgi:hypothetical protein
MDKRDADAKADFEIVLGQAPASKSLTLKRHMRTYAHNAAKKWLLPAVCVVMLSVFPTQCASVLRGTFSCEGVQVLSDELTLPEAEVYCRYAGQERKKVEEFWGATWNEPIRFHVSSAYRISRALVPSYLGNRGFMEMPLRRTQDNTGALLHEIVHIYAPNNNRFLAEGLAVYLHTTLAGNPAFPNFGEDLRHLAVRSLSGVKSLEALNSVRTPHPLSTVVDEKTAYVLAGSFVGFLIERHGLVLFRRLYETESYEEVYRKSFGTLETEWRASLPERSPAQSGLGSIFFRIPASSSR